jgi:proteic killer suppression protein
MVRRAALYLLPAHLIHLRDEELYTTGRGGKRYSRQIVDAFLRAIATIDAAADERDLYAQKGPHFEKLKGDRKGQRSIRLNQQFRLILTVAADQDGTLVWNIEVIDYY